MPLSFNHILRLVVVVAAFAALCGTAAAVVSAQDAKTQEAKVTFPYSGEVSGSSVRLRGGPSTQYSTIQVMHQGDKLEVVGSSSGWLEVYLPKTTACWISSKFIKLGEGDKASVTGKKINIRVSPDTKHYPVGQVSESEITVVQGEDGKAVTKNGYTKISPPSEARGWISADFIKEVSIEVKEQPTKEGDSGSEEPVKTTGPDPVVDKKPDGDQESEVDDAEGDAFKELDKLFLDELAKSSEERDLTKIAQLYSQYAEFATDVEVREKAKRRVELLKKTDDKIRKMLEKAKKEAKDAESDAAKAEAERKKKMEALNNEGKDENVTYIAIGKVAIHGKEAKTPASHALVDDSGDVIYYVRWEAGDLKPMLDKYVGLTGKTKEYEGWDKPVIIIERCDEIQTAKK